MDGADRRHARALEPGEERCLAYVLQGSQRLLEHSACRLPDLQRSQRRRAGLEAVRRKYAVDAVHYVDELAEVRRCCAAC